MFPPALFVEPTFMLISPVPCVPPAAVEISMEPDSPLLSAKLCPDLICTCPEYPDCEVPLSNANVPPVLRVLAPAVREILPPASPLPDATTISPPAAVATPVNNFALPLEPAAAFPLRADTCPEVTPAFCTLELARTTAPLDAESDAPEITDTNPPVCNVLSPADNCTLPATPLLSPTVIAIDETELPDPTVMETVPVSPTVDTPDETLTEPVSAFD